ncbi:MAG: hypothetical protein LBJ59_12265 [Zoogloeaceae bacterium]|jgi:hypothetical protein|nr:hypothetical protein [Zoogloeaceae bacterium]
MSALPSVASPRIGPTLPETLDGIRAFEDLLSQLPQADIVTRHVFHAGLYARTITIPAGVVLTGALIRRATLLVFSGHATMLTDDGAKTLRGYHVIPASAGRKQVFLAHADTELTMIFPTDARTVEEAEAEFTDEYERLLSRSGINEVTITGE